jgi:UDP-N-acetylglucosamine--N-acetylmuramyl-(pentapeptide) pyrophosphoryl-undecaprenol N-acetylglucosamine transferase
VSRPLSVVVAGGGTAGHISPALALADRLREDDPTVRITALGTARGLEVEMIPARGYDLELIPSVPLPRKPTADLLRVPGRVAAAVRAAGAVLERSAADVLVGFGSYVALPAYLAARRRRLPFVVHEANIRPGLGNRIGARLTPHVAVVNEAIRLPHARVVGLPLRATIRDLDRAGARGAAREHFGLDPDRPTLLVTGGSQGARSLNRAATAAAPALRAAGVQVLLVAGPKNVVSVADVSGGPPYVVLPFLEEMDLGYAAADMVLCRSGMNTVSELTAVGLPAAYVPLPIGNGEQRLNALPVVQAGGGLLVDDADLSPAWIESELIPVLRDSARLASMGRAAAALGHRDADVALARMVVEVARR